MPSRPQVASTDDWHQLELLARAPGQRAAEQIRPVVLFGQSPVERAAETGAAERTLYRQVARFDQLGMVSLVPPPKVERHRTLPPEVRQANLDAKREYPPLNVHELTTICWARCGHRPSSHTVKRVLAESPPPPRTHRRYPPYHAIADPTKRRLAIIRLHVEGWNAKSIAAYLETSRQTVHATLKCWAEEEFAGTPDRSRAPHRPATKVTLRAMVTVKELQENPLLGEFRIHAVLKVCGKLYTAEELHRIFYNTRFGRVLDRAGYARFRRWRVYAERGLGGEPVAVWLYAEHLILVYRNEPLAQYRVTYQPDQCRLQTMTPEQVFETSHQSPQPPLWMWSDDWLPVLRLPAYASRRSRVAAVVQPLLFPPEQTKA